MSRRVTLQQLEQLLPALAELEDLRLLIAGIAVPDTTKEWAGSSSYATIDRRLVPEAELDEAFAESEATLHQHVRELFALLRPVASAFYAGRPDQAALHLIELGAEQERRGWFDKARHCFNAALRLALPLPDKQAQILALRRLGRVCWSLGELHDAALFYQRSLQLARDADDQRNAVVAQTGAGNVLMMQGRWAEGERQYREALARADQMGAELELERAQLYVNLAAITMRQERYGEAAEWFDRARESWDRFGSPHDLAVYYHNLGILKRRLGERAAARDAFAQGLALDASPTLNMMNALELAEACVEEHALSEAERWAREAEEHAIASRSPYSLGVLYRELGNLARARGDADGFVFYEKALHIARERSYLLLEAETLVEYASLRKDIGGTEEAVSYLERARRLFRELGDVGAEGRAELLLREMPPQAEISGD